MAVKIRCPQCRDTFRWDTSKGWPERCQAGENGEGCGFVLGMPDRDEVVMPSIISMRTKIADRTYRDAENGSEQRISAASEILGVPKSELSDMRITNMKDSLRQGEAAAIEAPPNNAVSQQMQAMQRAGMPVGLVGASGASYSSAVQTGPVPNAGARAMNEVRDFHAKHADPRHAGAVTSSLPALETTSPGYKRRT